MNNYVEAKMLIEKRKLTSKRFTKDELYEYAAYLKVANETNKETLIMLINKYENIYK